MKRASRSRREEADVVVGLADEVRELMIATAGILEDALAYAARRKRNG